VDDEQARGSARSVNGKQPSMVPASEDKPLRLAVSLKGHDEDIRGVGGLSQRSSPSACSRFGSCSGSLPPIVHVFVAFLRFVFASRTDRSSHSAATPEIPAHALRPFVQSLTHVLAAMPGSA